MLDSLGVKSVQLMTNNPRKIAGLEQLGIKVTGRIPLVVPANRYNRRYLRTKAAKSGHLMSDPALEQMERPIVVTKTGSRSEPDDVAS
jgi:hypothetical protein